MHNCKLFTLDGNTIQTNKNVFFTAQSIKLNFAAKGDYSDVDKATLHSIR
jgi:hypothetical protein